MNHLPNGDSNLIEQIAQFHCGIVNVVGHAGPGSAELGLVLRNVRTAHVGKMKDAPSVGVLALDQSLVLQELEGRIDRPRAGTPDPATARRDLLDNFVAV